MIRRLALGTTISSLRSRCSPVRPGLTADDLIKFARTKSQDHLMAISGRRHLDEAVTDILLDRGNRDVIHKLAQNSGARFSEIGFTTLVVKAETDEQLAETVGLRLDVPSDLFEQLLLQATKTVQSRLLSLAPPETQREIRRVLGFVSKEIGWEVTAPRDLTRAQEIVKEQQQNGALHEQALVEFAKKHKYDELVAALSLLCSAPLDVINSLMGSPRNDGLLIPCRVAKLSWPAVATILHNRFAHHPLSDHDREKLSADYKRLSQATAQRVLEFWQARPVGIAATALIASSAGLVPALRAPQGVNWNYCAFVPPCRANLPSPACRATMPIRPVKKSQSPRRPWKAPASSCIVSSASATPRVRPVPAVRRFPQRPSGGLSGRIPVASASRHRDDHLCAGWHRRARRQPQQALALPQRLANQSDLAMLQVAQSAVYQPRRPRRRAAGDVTLVKDQQTQPTQAASRAIPAPLIPAPMTIRSNRDESFSKVTVRQHL